MNYSRILLSVTMVAFVGALVVGGTGAFFSDTETSEANVFTAGALDLQVDSVAHINGLVCFDGAWHPEAVVEWNEETEELQLVEAADVDGAIADYNQANPANVPAAGTDCASTWSLTDLGPENIFFDYGDLKPGDQGENTISLHVTDNDAYACAIIENVEDLDNGQTEPELEDGDDDGLEGELDSELSFFIWADDGDNIFEAEETGSVLVDGADGQDVAGSYELFTPETGPLTGAETQYLGVYWCYGEFEVVGTDITCDGGPVTNLSQTDSMMADITFYVEQARNNDDFECPLLDDEEEPDDRTLVGAVASAYVAPATQECTLFVDELATAPTAPTFNTLAAAEAAATDGDVICVDTGTYVEDVTVDVANLSILGLNDPKGGDKATLEGRMDIEANGVMISGLEFTNPDASFALVIDGVDNTEVSGNSFTTIGTTILGSAQAIYYDGGDAPASALTIRDNMIDTVGSATLEPGGEGTSAKGIFIGDSTAPSTLSGVVIEDNMISNIVASSDTFENGGRGAYGILINFGTGNTGSVVSPVIQNNDIRDLAGWWVHAVGLETSTPGAQTTLNAISDLTGASGDSTAVFYESNPNSDTTVNFNNFAPNVPFGVALHPTNQSSITVDAEDNWWGDNDPSDNVLESAGTIDYDPFEASAFPEN
ncbi:CalY family protein [Candidatus Pacebacteria bacterium]|nr:CalY family protein [Candidatus Paceibacterota bacterium]